jgi:hypothetical protein
MVKDLGPGYDQQGNREPVLHMRSELDSDLKISRVCS